MPFKSEAQAKWFNANRKRLERQGVDVDEWNKSTDFQKLPKKVTEAKTAEMPGWLLPVGGALAGGYLAKKYRDAQDPEDDGLLLPALGAAAGAGLGMAGNWGVEKFQQARADSARQDLWRRGQEAGMSPHDAGGMTFKGRYLDPGQAEEALKTREVNLAPDAEGMYRLRPGMRWAPSAGPGNFNTNAQQAGALGLDDVADKQHGYQVGREIAAAKPVPPAPGSFADRAAKLDAMTPMERRAMFDADAPARQQSYDAARAVPRPTTFAPATGK